MGGSPCIECGSRDTELLRYTDDHFRKVCRDCGHVGGPYVSNPPPGKQARVDDWEQGVDREQTYLGRWSGD